MATILKTDGTVQNVTPANGKSFTLEEMQGFVGGNIELTRTMTGRPMIVNEEGKLKGLPRNDVATFLHANPRDTIVGDAVIGTETEMGGNDEDTDE